MPEWLADVAARPRPKGKRPIRRSVLETPNGGRFEVVGRSGVVQERRQADRAAKPLGSALAGAAQRQNRRIWDEMHRFLPPEGWSGSGHDAMANGVSKFKGNAFGEKNANFARRGGDSAWPVLVVI